MPKLNRTLTNVPRTSAVRELLKLRDYGANPSQNARTTGQERHDNDPGRGSQRAGGTNIMV